MQACWNLMQALLFSCGCKIILISEFFPNLQANQYPAAKYYWYFTYTKRSGDDLYLWPTYKQTPSILTRSFFPSIIQNCGALPDYKPKRWDSWAAVSDVWDWAAATIIQRLKSIRWKAKVQTDRFFYKYMLGSRVCGREIFSPFLMLQMRHKRWHTGGWETGKDVITPSLSLSELCRF